MNKEKIRKRILELEEEKTIIQKSKTPIWLYLILWMIPLIGWAFIPLPYIIKKAKITAIENEIQNLDLYI